MSLYDLIREMPKVELHVHLEGSIQPDTLLELAKRNDVILPVNTHDQLEKWYKFRDFAHFLEIYFIISSCICTADDIDLIARKFLQDQAAQHILYSEVTFTPYTHYSLNRQIPFQDQLAALQRAQKWAKEELGIRVGWVLDISRNVRPVEHAMTVAEWAILGKEHGVVALGIGGPEIGNPAELFQTAFDYAYKAGLPCVPHAGETEGAKSIWDAIHLLHACRIGHGVRCLEDPDLVTLLRHRQIPLEVCPSSNVCLGVVTNLGDHPLPRLLKEGLYVTINSDDPAMFNTTLTDEYLRIVRALAFDVDQIQQLVINGVRATLLSDESHEHMEQQFRQKFVELRCHYQI
ncbi:unnamed protein product [Didymodactylos carnosus]|uniref:Adenosine deaminase domain-containing protein n=1 Tax=Didymodactylos carnosus TaxID=1234261 RepID=A0A814MDC5_9BILA|nr:unnamed protein product [Didymodactylos carnosus]CAF1443784.1 unnamed protein product [Didymodactylos carnosus]CAF3841676.1 unnamed protein product [Didymodactylos carnosus]CAF4239588.1 unnamed protein product [Didymodactylos carnosus]